jgi:GTP-binding protein
MKFIDEARIQVSAGAGGRGCVSFRREKYVPRGGPDGGDGGKGGDVILVADPQLESLIDFRYKRHYKASSGAHGRGKHQHGKNGADRIIPVPVGTVICDADSGNVIADLSRPDEQIIIARGGEGGRGNARFASSTRQAPRIAEPGTGGEQRWITLELKLLAEVGVVGLPNSGKSTLVADLSGAKPKIADYPFTTIRPVLGAVRYAGDRTFTIADIPGLIEGAHTGRGLGTAFLRHIERTRVLIHLIDGSTASLHEPAEAFSIISSELTMHNPALAKKPRIVAINKMDQPGARERYPAMRQAFRRNKVKTFPVSALTGAGLKPLVAEVARLLEIAADD